MAARTASREKIRAHVAPAVLPRIIVNRLLAVGLRPRVPLARLPHTARHHQARILWCRERVVWRVEVRTVVFSYESRFSVYASDGRTRIGADLVSIIFLSSFVHDIHPHLRLHGVGAISYNSRSHLQFLLGKVNTARYIVQVLNPVLLPFLRKEGDMLFQ